MTATSNPAPSPQEWDKLRQQPGTSSAKVDRFQRDFADVQRKLPKTADEARDQAHRAYITAVVTLATAQRLTFRIRKRKKLLEMANLGFASAHWLMLEEQRLRSLGHDAPRYPR
ncbi:hypothetical protein AB5J62_33670 [Amycolatopsis sp. cg5]|uniref:hypothetical protein n=1 Tax=Amycolatopsis sp. cg5 TaxID=3238802 RepID=UPI003523767F